MAGIPSPDAAGDSTSLELWLALIDTPIGTPKTHKCPPRRSPLGQVKSKILTMCDAGSHVLHGFVYKAIHAQSVTTAPQDEDSAHRLPVSHADFTPTNQQRERQLLNDKNKTDPGNLGKSLAPVYQSVNP
ncbi:hypothetical protein CSKR_114139 [Clonorchis sinensis]|uniref:Uncharacterized protein n=1 Tax=Clonorchis sinensis TaxID=79923 RepID=A0A419PNA8_CLOSI|nr:hypothetical protein CSKR_114139 [Clonorchis sinensis]